MQVRLYRELRQIKGGWSARSEILHIAAHGYSPEAADKNLQRLIRLFLSPFEREGTLATETKPLGFEIVERLDEVQIVFE